MAQFTYTSLEEIDKIHKDLHAGFISGKTKGVAYRKYQLLQLGYLLKDNADRFKEALQVDLGRPAFETNFMEIGVSISEVRIAAEKVAKWAKPEYPPFNFTWQPMRRVIRKEPKGAVVIIVPFNYPIFCLVSPLVGALAAGNTALVKPSELAPCTSALFSELVPKYLDSDVVRIVNGGVAETTRVLELKWDHILYTGGGRVAKVIATAAAKQLTPVSLELGGKNPVIVDTKCDLKLAARRILWGRMTNCGQTCVAPDYAIVLEDTQEKFVAALKDVYLEFWPKGPAESPDFARIVSKGHWSRITNLIANTRGKIVLGGEFKEESKYIAPTIVTDVKPDDSLMSEEIFGPVLPIMPVKSYDAALQYINSNEHPLTIYVFTNDSELKAKIFDNTQSGGCVANETIIWPGAEGLPFGGIGPSGSGYHSGKYSFDMFTHLRASMDVPYWLDFVLGVRYPPYTPQKLSMSKMVVSDKLPARPKGPPRTVTSSKLWYDQRFLFAITLVVVAALSQRSVTVHNLLSRFFPRDL